MSSINKSINKLQKKYIDEELHRACAYTCYALLREWGVKGAERFCEKKYVTPPEFAKNPDPDEDEHKKNSHESNIKRLTSADWWLKKLIQAGYRKREHSFIKMGKVSKNGMAYVSDETAEKFVEQKNKEEAYRRATTLVSEYGDEINLQYAYEKGANNPVNKLNRVMVMTKGQEQLADEHQIPADLIDDLPDNLTFDSENKGVTQDDVPHLQSIVDEALDADDKDMTIKLALTFTPPSRFHRKKLDKKAGKYFNNEKYDDSTPKACQIWLQETWTKITRECGEQKISITGIKVLEPHGDGAIHYHAAVYLRARDAIEFINIMYKHALRGEDGNEKGAKRRRVNWRVMAGNEGMTGYFVKYIAKGLVGKQNEKGEYDLEMNVESKLVRSNAHASIWGLRKFSFIGLPSITVWNELRRVHEPIDDNATLEAARIACGVVANEDENIDAQAADFAEYIRVNGGFYCKRNDRPIRPWNEDARDSEGNVKHGLYGERSNKLLGVKIGDFTYLTRDTEWTLINKNAVVRLLEQQVKKRGGDINLLSGKIISIVEDAVEKKQLHKIAGKVGVVLPFKIKKRPFKSWDDDMEGGWDEPSADEGDWDEPDMDSGWNEPDMDEPVFDTATAWSEEPDMDDSWDNADWDEPDMDDGWSDADTGNDVAIARSASYLYLYLYLCVLTSEKSESPDDDIDTNDGDWDDDFDDWDADLE